jgi:hypothetical protein
VWYPVDRGKATCVQNPPAGLSTLAERLRALDRARQVNYLGSDQGDGTYAVEVAGQLREYPALRMVNWLDGYTAGHGRAPQPAERRSPDAIATVRAVLVHPTLTDQTRIRIRVAMEDERVGVKELAGRIPVTLKSVVESLRWLSPGTIGMMAVLGHDPGARPDLAAVDPATPLQPTAPDGWPEPQILTTFRLLGYAHEQGVVSWVDPTNVNLATRARTFTVLVGDDPVQVHVDAIPPWLVGVGDAVMPDVAQRLYESQAAIAP